ncbi:MAG: hypothetical protein RL693_2144, partial [Verrucomicrobiota bacterium]
SAVLNWAESPQAVRESEKTRRPSNEETGTNNGGGKIRDLPDVVSGSLIIERVVIKQYPRPIKALEAVP